MPLGLMAFNVNYSFVDERKAENPNLDRGSYSLLNARASLSTLGLAAGSLTVAAWVKNALDEDYAAFAIDNLPHAGRAVLWGETRTWGIDLEYEF